jgi:hypothetical protein
VLASKIRQLCIEAEAAKHAKKRGISINTTASGRTVVQTRPFPLYSSSSSACESDSAVDVQSIKLSSLNNTSNAILVDPQLQQEQEQSAQQQFGASATPKSKLIETANLNFASNMNLRDLRCDIERKLNINLGSADGLVKLILTQQLQISTLSKEIKTMSETLRSATTAISTLINTINNSNDSFSTSTPTFEVESVATFQDYIDFGMKLKDRAYEKQVVRIF